jgi:tetratricopeptide (TPR) repeat protein
MYHKAPELPDAKQYILDALTQNKLVFVGEYHTQLNEELFIAENLQAFYDAGLRYIFVEGSELDDDPSQTPLLIYPPWRNDVGGRIAGGTYGGDAIGQAIRTINDAVPEAERIREIPAEAGYNPAPGESDLNKRDQQAFKNISAFMEKLPPNKKAMIFYGSDHGRTKPAEWRVDSGEPFLWTPMGAYLKEQYGDNFISMVPLSAKDEMRYLSLDIPELQDSGSKPKMALSNSSHDVVNNARIRQVLSQHDAALLDQEALYGIGGNYYPSYEQLFAMYNALRNLENSIDMWKDDVATFRFQEQGQYVQLIYYLKLWLGDSFDYRLWDTVKPAPVVIRLRDTKNSLREALDNLNTSAIQEIALTLNAQDAQHTQRMRDYTKVMLMSGVMPLVLENPSEEALQEIFPWIADHMKEAIALFPQDLWSYYWLAYAETELGDYDAAIAHWEYIIAQPLSYCLETLPRVYQKLSACYAAKGDQAKSGEYRKTGESLLNEHDLIVTNLNDVR